jgi:hypothetical protein
MTQRRTWAYPIGLLAGYCGLAAATGIAVAVGGAGRPGIALGILAAATLLLATRTKMLAAPALGVMALLFYAGFIAGRHGGLTWQGMDDVWRLGILAGSAVLGAGLSWLAARSPRSRSSRSHETPSGQAVVISLVEARAGRRG